MLAISHKCVVLQMRAPLHNALILLGPLLNLDSLAVVPLSPAKKV